MYSILATTSITSNLLGVVNIHHALLLGPILLIRIDRSLSKNLGFRRLAVKHSGNLLKSATLSFREKEVDGRDHRCECANVDEVELPGDGFKCDGIDELVEDWIMD
jgi:hypothetical protein